MSCWGPGVVEADEGEPVAVIALDHDDEPALVQPHRAVRFDELARRAARDRHEPHGSSSP